jgi:hypothetical protein
MALLSQELLTLDFQVALLHKLVLMPHYFVMQPAHLRNEVTVL